MIILGIESSCDDTSVAIINDSREILANIVQTDIDSHAQFGGIVPEIASRNHLEFMMPTINTALEKAGVTLQDINLITVTSGPGLIGGVIVGVMTAKL